MENIDYLHNEVEKLRGSSWYISTISFLKSKIGIGVFVLIILFVLLYFIFPRTEEETIVKDPDNSHGFRRKKETRLEWKKFFALYVVIVILICFGVFQSRRNFS
jgi:Na+/H+ antiporter NhaD/arsenite permease-like protein